MIQDWGHNTLLASDVDEALSLLRSPKHIDALFTDIYLELPITLTEAVLGARIKVPTPTGAVTMTVPKGSNTGTTLRLRGKGAPKLAGGYGDQLVKLKVELPKEPDPELEAFVSSWGGGKAYNPREEVKP